MTIDQFNAREKVVEEIKGGEEERGLYVGMQDILPLYWVPVGSNKWVESVSLCILIEKQLAIAWPLPVSNYKQQMS